MDVLMVILRLIHIISGVFWVGSTFMLFRFVQPSVQATGDAGREFMAHLGMKTNFSPMMGISGTLTALSGVTMYFIVFDSLSVGLSSDYGLSLAIGGLFGLVALALGFLIQFRSIARMKTISQRIASADGPPSPEQMAEMAEMAKRLETGTKLGAVLMTVALVGMSVAQYV